MTPILLLPECAHAIGAIPFVWLCWRRFSGRETPTVYWWVAAGYFVSWLADSAAHWVDPWVIAAVYPVSQASIIAAGFLPPIGAWTFTMTLMTGAMADIAWHGVAGPLILLRVVAWLPLVWIACGLWRLPWLRISLLMSYGVGLLWWGAYIVSPGYLTWGGLQLTRFVAAICLCMGASRPGYQGRDPLAAPPFTRK